MRRSEVDQDNGGRHAISDDPIGEFGDVAHGEPVRSRIPVVAGHSVEVPITCEKAGINPDFYMQTLHSHDSSML